MTWERPRGEGLDYQLCQYGQSRLLVRGPKVRLAPPYTVFLGGTETYGRFVAEPFPERVRAQTGLRVANISCINAGLDAFAEDNSLLAVAGGAETLVIQVLGAANLSNDFYTVHPRRNDRFLGATPALVDLYPEIDFTEYTFTRHLLLSLEACCPDRFSTVVANLKARWHIQMHRLISEAHHGAILLWIASTPPPEQANGVNDAPDPLFVDRQMLDAVAERVSELVEIVPSETALSTGTDGMVFTDFEAHVACLSLGVAAHAEVAEAISPILEKRTRAA